LDVLGSVPYLLQNPKTPSLIYYKMNHYGIAATLVVIGSAEQLMG